jgi:uncharacterized protein (DUF952 family)
MNIFHLLSRSAWEQALAAGIYRPASLSSDGFIHCSPAERVAEVAEAFYSGHDDLVLLEIDPDRLTSRLVFEAGTDRPGSFPHLYGPLNLEAVVEATSYGG